MAKEIKVQETIQSDFSVVVNDIAEELLTRLNMDEDGSVIDMFQTGSFDPWQLFVFFGALEKALIEFRTDKRKKTVIVHAQPEALLGIGRVVTPVSTMLEHVLMSRLNDMSEGRLETGMLTVSAESIDYEGVHLKGRHVVIICDIHDNESPYLAECIKLCRLYNNGGYGCGGCTHFVKTNSVTLVDNVLVLNIPQATYSNKEKV